MHGQSLILQTLTQDASIDRVAAILSQEHFATRHAAVRRVCEEFDFKDRLGRLQLTSCLQALQSLQARTSRFCLPTPSKKPAPGAGRPALLADGARLARDVPKKLSQVDGLQIVPVRGKAHRLLWNTLIASEHRQGMTTFAGAQMRYLVDSDHGHLGAVGFAASALRLAARERWIAWSDEQRQAHLLRVVGLSRFLIRKGCRNLASHVLGRVLRRLPRDFKERYGYSPWLVETFVTPDQLGTSLRAANFVKIGSTAGRGRQDRDNRRAAGVKDVYMYELRPDWRQLLGVPWVDPAPSLGPGEGLAGRVWARNEFGGAELGDKRLTDRLVRSVELLAERPGRAISSHPLADNAAADGWYRLLEQPAESAVSVPNILAAHRQRSIQRMRGQRTVLCIQDGSDLRFATRPGCEGLEVIGRNQTKSKTLGLHLHLTLATTAHGLPLGVLRCGFGTPPKQAGGKSRRWIEGYRDIGQAARELTGRTRVIAVMDREADFFGLFDEQRRQGRVETLVRAKHDRRLAGEAGKLFEVLAAGPADGAVRVDIEGLVKRPKSSRKKARPARVKRQAWCELRHRRLRVPATIAGAEELTLWGVHIVEKEPPEGESAVQWYLLASWEVADAEGAAEVVRHYLQRWRVEDFFRVLKSGCRVQYLRFRTADRLQRAIAINSVIAWRLLLLTLLGRQVPDCEPQLLFTDDELEFLKEYAEIEGLAGPDSLGAASSLVADLGGYRARKHDPPPGSQLMWEGYDTLTKATWGHRIRAQYAARHGSQD